MRPCWICAVLIAALTGPDRRTVVVADGPNAEADRQAIVRAFQLMPRQPDRVAVINAEDLRRLAAPRARITMAGAGAFEIARRNRFVRELAKVPDGVSVHVLPTGDPSPPAYNDLAQLRYRNLRGSDRRIAWAYAATDAYLAGLR